jgi:hypothetical protein
MRFVLDERAFRCRNRTAGSHGESGNGANQVWGYGHFCCNNRRACIADDRLEGCFDERKS